MSSASSDAGSSGARLCLGVLERGGAGGGRGPASQRSGLTAWQRANCWVCERGACVLVARPWEARLGRVGCVFGLGWWWELINHSSQCCGGAARMAACCPGGCGALLAWAFGSTAPCALMAGWGRPALYQKPRPVAMAQHWVYHKARRSGHRASQVRARWVC